MTHHGTISASTSTRSDSASVRNVAREAESSGVPFPEQVQAIV